MTDAQEPRSENEQSDKPATKPDTVADPSLDKGEGTDWSSEGGALPGGPATDPSASDEDEPDTEG